MVFLASALVCKTTASKHQIDARVKPMYDPTAIEVEVGGV
jgi:hypothetical protein